jgi:hypothetical protein
MWLPRHGFMAEGSAPTVNRRACWITEPAL